ncbi:hypothetical protein ACRALDRAFT_2014818 [Sodiomyces alcalophilus JCM 7366]|uniref:uncharacterized protein n=1 Tax=Sodiomyces alcalophilus JCM 7366 TaxID=591952 RepID=UPI0039B4EFBA
MGKGYHNECTHTECKHLIPSLLLPCGFHTDNIAVPNAVRSSNVVLTLVVRWASTMKRFEARFSFQAGLLKLPCADAATPRTLAPAQPPFWEQESQAVSKIPTAFVENLTSATLDGRKGEMLGMPMASRDAATMAARSQPNRRMSLTEANVIRPANGDKVAWLNEFSERRKLATSHLIPNLKYPSVVADSQSRPKAEKC